MSFYTYLSNFNEKMTTFKEVFLTCLKVGLKYKEKQEWHQQDAHDWNYKFDSYNAIEDSLLNT